MIPGGFVKRFELHLVSDGSVFVSLAKKPHWPSLTFAFVLHREKLGIPEKTGNIKVIHAYLEEWEGEFSWVVSGLDSFCLANSVISG